MHVMFVLLDDVEVPAHLAGSDFSIHITQITLGWSLLGVPIISLQLGAMVYHCLLVSKIMRFAVHNSCLLLPVHA